MKYSEDLIEEVRVRNDIVSVISQYVRLTRSGSSSYKGLCPFHNEKTPSFSVSGQKQLYHCFGCGASGNVYNFVMQYENVSFSEALSQLAERAGVTLPKIEYSAQAKELSQKKTDLLTIHRQAAQYYYTLLKQDVGREALAYLKNRGLSDETIRSFGLGYSDAGGGGLYRFLKGKGYSDELLLESGLFLLDERRGLLVDKFRGRVMFPIMDSNSRVIGFGGRVMGDEKPKYLNSPETIIFEKRRNLYGLHAARKSREDSLILCEGYMDVIAMHQAGFTNAVASLGTALTPGHATLMRHYAKQVLLIYDSDGAGIRATQRAVPILREASLPSRVVNLKPHKDPDEFIRAEGAEAFRERLSNAEDSFMKLVDIEASLRNLADPQGQNLFFDAVAMLLFELGDGVERRVYADAVTKKYGPSGMTSEDLLGRVTRLAMKGVRPLREQAASPEKREEKRSKAPKEKGSVVAQKLILTWLVNYPSLTGLIMEYIQPEDFTEELYREVATMVFDQAKAGDVNVSRLLNHFMDSEQHTTVAALFNEQIVLEGKEQLANAFADAVIRIKRSSMDQKKGTEGQENIMAFYQQMKDLQQLQSKRGDLSKRFLEAIRKESE